MNPTIGQFMQGVAAQPPETWYDQVRKEYLIRNPRGEWLSFNETQYKRVLKQRGLPAKVAPGELVSAQEQAILDIQQNRNVLFAGPLAGHSAGIYEFGGTRLLVTSSPRIIQPAPGPWPTVESLLTGLLGDGKEIQHFYGWIKIGYESLRNGQIRPGQAVVFCGPHDCGKSLVQNLLTEVFGGRAAKPYQSMTGGTGFNADLFGAEHLTIEDEQPSTDIRSRRAFGAQIKNVTVNQVQRLHAKYRDAITLEPFWRLTVSLNDEDENILVLPPMDDSLTDKIMIFKVQRRAMPMPTETLQQRKDFWDRLISELPGFLHFIQNWDIPDEMRSERFGVKEYQDPEILSILESLSPEFQLLSLIDAEIWGPTQAGLHGLTPKEDHKDMTAEAVERLLTNSTSSYEARRLLSWPNATGTYLGRLAKKRPDRVKKARTGHERLWMIKRPGGGRQEAAA